MQYKCELLDLLMNTPNVEVMWVKKVGYNTTVNMEFCDYMICSSDAGNLGTDVLRTVSNATLVQQEKTDSGYDVAVYKNVSSNTTVTQTRQYSQTVVIGIKCYVDKVKNTNQGIYISNFSLNGEVVSGTHQCPQTFLSFDVSNYTSLHIEKCTIGTVSVAGAPLLKIWGDDVLLNDTTYTADFSDMTIDISPYNSLKFELWRRMSDGGITLTGISIN